MKYYKELGFEVEREDRKIYFQTPNSKLIEKAVNYGHGGLSNTGALVVKTGKHTGRSAGDKYVVKSDKTKDTIWWDNALNEMSIETFEKLKQKAISYLNQDNKDLFITENSVGAIEEHNVGVRLITDRPSHALFSNYLFRDKMKEFGENDFTIIHAPELKVDPNEFGTKSETVVATCFDTHTTIIIGTLYAGEIKKSMFCVLNYMLPEKNILPMHAGANRLENSETSVFFGLSGTGKTTLSTDEGTLLIGDDEHGLSDDGIFNFEGGCYAKTYKLSKETEPAIYKASNRFGSLLENVILGDKTNSADFFDKSITENGRSSYPLDFIDDLEESSHGEIPKHIFFLCADAFGVIPPVSKLSIEQSMFYFVLGYTAKLAGTEIGVKEPQATFSPCFGSPFMLRHPSEYAKLLGHYLEKYNIKVWLINTGWTGGGHGVGQRFPLHITRQIIRSIQSNELNDVETEKDPIFGLDIPKTVKEVPSSILLPKKSWPVADEFDTTAQKLAKSFHDQMKKFGDFYEANIAGAPTYKGN